MTTSRIRRVTAAACAGAALAMAAGLHGLVGPSSARSGTEPPAGAEISPEVATCNTTLPPAAPASVTPDMVRRGLPCSVAFDGKNVEVSLANLQLAFDFNSWLSFAALNAPASGGRRQWQGWQDLSDLMLETGAAPPPFGTSLPPPTICTGGAAGAPVIRQISKTPTTPTISVAGQPLNTGPLIDQDGNYARYQILVNKPMYDYVVSNGLYSKAGQKRFSGKIQFPAGETTKDTTGGRIGAIVVKVAWKVLSGRDDPAAFLTTQGYVYTPASAGVREACRTGTLGLVGMHIVHKEQREPQWNWATFEHLGNVPDAPTTSGRFSFYDPSCGGACPVNQQPPQPWDPSIPPHPGMFRSQIMRKTQYPIEATNSASHWNEKFHNVLKDKGLNDYKILTKYKLITTQWPTAPDSKTDPNGSPFPLFSANATMETYVQGNVPQASSSCIACHGNATDTSGKVSDFTFILEKAH
jgi:hypothetical protein